MKPFNLEAAMRGEPIVTRDGRKAKFVAYVPELADGSKVVACVESRRSVVSYYADGKYCGGIDDCMDLLMYEPTLTLAGIEFPEPLRDDPAIDQQVWVIGLINGAPMNFYWHGYDYQINLLKRGLLQATKEGAELQLRAMIKSVGGSYE